MISEGYPLAAQKFASEANIPTTEDVASIQERVEIRNAIHAGDIQSAIEKINDLNHQVCLVFLLSPHCDDYILFHAPLIYSSSDDDHQTFSLQYEQCCPSLSDIEPSGNSRH